jgi:hypothetical protein
VCDMPDSERETAMGTLERFAAGGERFGVHNQDGEEVKRGYRREVPRQLLVEQGLDYQVEVTTRDATDVEPYRVGIAASRTVDMETALPTAADGSEQLPEPAEGKEVKCVTFTAESVTPGVESVRTVEASSVLIGGHQGTIQIDPDDPSPRIRIAMTFDDGAPLLQLDEARAITRAVELANELPPDAPEFTTPYIPPYEAPYPGQPDTDLSEEQGETHTDLTQAGRRQIINGIDAYAKSGGEVIDEGNVCYYERDIPLEILRQHGIGGEVRVVAMEGTDYSYYRYGFRMSERVDRVLSGRENLGPLPGRKEAFYGFFEVGGKRDGTHGHGESDNPTGGRGVHTTYVEYESFWRRPEDIGNGEKVLQNGDIHSTLSLTQARSLYNALRQARQAEEQG